MKHLLSILWLFVLSCDSDSAEIEGCIDVNACNYDETATVNNNGCTYAEENFDCDDNCIVELDLCGGCNEYVQLFEDCYNIETTIYLDLSYNGLTYLPESIGDLTNLEYLRLSNNQLTSLPENIGELSNLHTLILSYNQLTSLSEDIG